MVVYDYIGLFCWDGSFLNYIKYTYLLHGKNTTSPCNLVGSHEACGIIMDNASSNDGFNFDC